ncbi:MAG: DUF4827 domain-containing protein [Prevotella sp.]|nr:DUF4827 domain-containing protein [Prevotella sp.]
MKKSVIALFSIVAFICMMSCNDYETYAEQKEKENNAISKFLKDSSVTVISEAQFKDHGFKTDVSKNEYVFFSQTGVYLQIVREGCGSILKSGETATVLCRFWERNLLTDSIQLTNDVLAYNYRPDKMSVTRSSDTFVASYIDGESLMAGTYSSVSVPSGWLVPLLYVKIGRWEKEGDEIAKVKLIVPHTQGHSYASSGVYPCHYTITYEKGI